MAKMGRPKKPRGQVRKDYINVRVTAAEKRTLERAAKSDGKELVPWIRDLALAAAGVQ